MSETIKIFFMFILLIAVLILVLRIAGWKLKSAADTIMKDLKKQKAFDPVSAVRLPYSKGTPFHLGLKDYRPKALELLIRQNLVQVLPEGKYYLRGEGENRGSGLEAKD